MLQPYENMDYVIIKKLHQCRSRGLYEAYPYMNTPAVVSAMNRMGSRGFFHIWTTQEQAESLTIPVLKSLLKERRLPCQGKKAELAARAVSSIPPARIYAAAGNFDQLRLTEAGQAYFSYLEEARNQEYDDLIERMRALILQGDLNTAKQVLCQYRACQFYERGADTDWAKEASRPVPAAEAHAIMAYLTKSPDPQAAATTAVYQWLWNPKDFRQYMQRHPERAIDMEQLLYGCSVLRSLRKLNECTEMEGEKALYEICANDDACAVCKKHEGKTYPVRSAHIGQNCPPFHLGCHCYILPVAWYADGTRIIPVTRTGGQRPTASQDEPPSLLGHLKTAVQSLFKKK